MRLVFPFFPQLISHTDAAAEKLRAPPSISKSKSKSKWIFRSCAAASKTRGCVQRDTAIKVCGNGPSYGPLSLYKQDPLSESLVVQVSLSKIPSFLTTNPFPQLSHIPQGILCPVFPLDAPLRHSFSQIFFSVFPIASPLPSKVFKQRTLGFPFRPFSPEQRTEV